MTDYSLAGINFGQDKRFQVSVHLKTKWWLPLFFERLMVPRFVVEITNNGKDISEGVVECDLVEHDDPHSYLAIKKEFINFQNFQFKEFKSGTTKKFNIKIDSNFLKPSRYVIRIKVMRYKPDESSIYEEMIRLGVENKQITVKTTEGNKEISLEEYANIRPEIKEPRKNFSRGYQIGDYRWNKIIVIHPLSFLVGGILGTIIALISLAIALIQLVI